MKKTKVILMAAASFLGLAGTLAFTKPYSGGWKDGAFQVKGPLHGQYTCDNSPDITCTYTDASMSTRFDTGVYTLH